MYAPHHSLSSSLTNYLPSLHVAAMQTATTVIGPFGTIPFQASAPVLSGIANTRDCELIKHEHKWNMSDEDAVHW